MYIQPNMKFVLNQREVHEFVRHYAKATLSQFQTATADLAQAMKTDEAEAENFNYQPQPKYQEQFNLHRAVLSLNDKPISGLLFQQIY